MALLLVLLLALLLLLLLVLWLLLLVLWLLLLVLLLVVLLLRRLVVLALTLSLSLVGRGVLSTAVLAVLRVRRVLRAAAVLLLLLLRLVVLLLGRGIVALGRWRGVVVRRSLLVASLLHAVHRSMGGLGAQRHSAYLLIVVARGWLALLRIVALLPRIAVAEAALLLAAAAAVVSLT
ncbi:hypothetical protein B0T25DRAFT_267557 [Lasiosphaeria hispida]|uniref:Uncharacterized protein n=1 Tax=Lasiosphaeria hispida TaxID=260671 RepID=A0AAJ0HBA8_9PEZI|nr:hypothetical protein B0T25DRAFT_267557 [Lasiosphaeria hispida]